MIGLLNSGISGYSLGHADIGGYTSSTIPLVAHYGRSKNLLWRWIEMSAFSDMIMRSHPSNLPNINYQIYDEVDTMQFMAKFTNIHKSLASYKLRLMKEAH